MKIEFLKDGSADCPLIRIYGYEPGALAGLQQAFEQLAQGVVPEFTLTDLPGVEPLDGCRLAATVGKWDRGVLQRARNDFEWVLTQGAWDNVAGLVAPFAGAGAGGHQWLQQSGQIAVLISLSGCW